MDRFDGMTAFARVVELGSFARAATSLSLPKTTVSAQVAALERHLGTRLLNRTTRSVSLTPDGAAFHDRVVTLLSDLADAEATVTAGQARPRGRLRIDMPPAVGKRIVIPALGSFLERYPEVVLEVGCTDRPVDLIPEGVDCVIRGNLIHDDTLIARRLGTFDVATGASPSYLARHGTPTTPAELEHHLWCRLFSAKMRGFFTGNFTKGGVRATVEGRHASAFNDIDSALAGALAGLGVVQLPLYILDEHFASGRLLRVLPEFVSDGVPVHFLYPKTRMQSAKVRAFAAWTRELFAATRHVTV